MVLNTVIQQLFDRSPVSTLYHYTTLSGLQGIVQSQVLWASDVRYMNDAAELHHMMNLLTESVEKRLHHYTLSGDVSSYQYQLLEHFSHWITERLSHGHLLFAASFRANGNLLSQWRGYSTIGKGVSLGFNPQHITHWASAQGFQVGQCIYDLTQQKILIEQVVDAICEMPIAFETIAHDQPESSQLLRNQWFCDIETDLLRLAVLFKHPSFEEEAEWRVILPIAHHPDDHRIKFREGNAMLKPYTEFALHSPGQEMDLAHVFLGPSPDSPLSMHSLRLFLEHHQLMPRDGISDSNIPYRAC